ncbi:hypothetical protein ILUMI_09786 [Ignelater luminosus]|uniref:HTH psq-type domain-containing protein n=1 Tax=Ignelater luminosus TaxID=2038154 RepID=A0A8K0D1P6_IGNLU|nr:hypothetical protein ILUMI_09786 [Ignelater luminosus]
MSRYKKENDQQSWSSDDMASALKAMLDEKIGYYKESTRFNVPQTTLENRMEKVKSGMSVEEASRKGGLGRYKPVIICNEEKELVNHVLFLESRVFGPTTTELGQLALFGKPYVKAATIETALNGFRKIK